MFLFFIFSMSQYPHPRHCLNITKKERIFRRAFNRNRWSRVPQNRINRIISLLQDIERCQRNNSAYDRLIAQGNTSPGFERQLYPTLEYSSSEYEDDSPDEEEVSSNESTKSQCHSNQTEIEEENQEPEFPRASSSVRILSNSPQPRILSNSPQSGIPQTSMSTDIINTSTPSMDELISVEETLY